jgi:xylan 1,4-beta-xylosidase
LERIIRADAKAPAKPLVHFWSFCVGAGRANEGLRANWLRQLKRAVDECGFRYIRFHGLFHDDMFVYRKGEDGKAKYNWQYVDELFDSLLEIGIRPFVEFSFCPKDMTSGTDTMFWWKCNVNPPADFDEWGRLIEKAVTHWVGRYGLEEVRKWYFEVWNEPDLHGFWASTKSEYFRLYQVTVQAVKRVDGKLRVGGPATSNFVPDDRFDGEELDESRQLTFKGGDIDVLPWRAVWVEDFLAYCAREGLPVDFVSTHPYPTDFGFDDNGVYRSESRSVHSTRDDLLWLRNCLDRGPYKNAELHLTEWSSSPSPRDCSHDFLPAAAFVVKTNLESSGLTDSLSYWTFTDVFEESGGGESVFYGGFGMFSFQGVPKPTYHAYRFLNRLGDGELARCEGCIVTKDRTGAVSALLYNYPDEVRGSIPIAYYPDREKAEKVQRTGSAKRFDLRIEHLEPGARFLVETLDEEHGCAMTEWKKMGMPDPPSREQTAELVRLADATKKERVSSDGDGVLRFERDVAPWSLVLIRQE